jgi:hypothetical protein
MTAPPTAVPPTAVLPAAVLPVDAAQSKPTSLPTRGAVHADLKRQKVIEDELRCPICWDSPPCDPHSTPCGHTFCRSCIMQALACKKECPSCRSHVTSHRVLSRVDICNDTPGEAPPATAPPTAVPPTAVLPPCCPLLLLAAAAQPAAATAQLAVVRSEDQRELRKCATQSAAKSVFNGALVGPGDEVEILLTEEAEGITFYHIRCGRKKGFIRAEYVELM